MRINKISMNSKAANAVFRGLRTDKNLVGQLKTGNKPIIENNKRNIYAALNNMSARTDRDSIEFLLDVADNLAYGQGGAHSKFKEALDKEGYTPSERENTDWSFILQDTIKKALSSSKGYNDDLEAEYKRIFGEERQLKPWQKNLLELRQTLSASIVDDFVLDDAQTLAQGARVRKNLDYFIASSEIPASQKQECLEKFITFMSDDYQINPQLADKKLQVLDEMLNDLVIKTPENEVLSIKDVNQRQSGMCAAISICRKAMAYEDKSRFVDLIMEELKDSDVMSVFDISELGSGKKVDIPKTEVDFISEMEKGYRIIDASAHHWMHNAHASGNGTLLTEHYIAPTSENYGIFDDSSWYLGLSDEASDKKPLLMAVIKEREFIDSYSKYIEEMKDSQENVSAVRKYTVDIQSKTAGKLNSIFAQIFPLKQDREISHLIKSLIEFYKGTDENNEVNVSSKLPKEVRIDVLTKYLIDSVEDITPEQQAQIKENAKNIFEMADTYVDADKQLKKLKRFNTPRSKYILNKKLFKIAAAHRLALEEDINLPDGVVRYEKAVGLPTRDEQVLNFLTSLEPNIPSEAKESLAQDIFQIECVLPKELDFVMQKVFGKDIKRLLCEMFELLQDSVAKGDADTIENIRIQGTLGDDKTHILKNITKWQEKLADNPSKEDIGEAVRVLGYENKYQLAFVYFKSLIANMQQGISEEQYESLVSQFGGEDKIETTINSQAQKLQEIQETYQSITEKWHVPSSRMLILEKLEKSKDILSREKLDMLQAHFDYIDSQMYKNESVKNTKKRTEANEQLYKFNEEENTIFDSLAKKVSSMRKYAKMTYNVLNELLYDDLSEQYAYIGMLNGQFWVREEGSSGLSTNEQIRILEQMTGKPYHYESDIKSAAEEIKKGEGGGIISLSVEDDDYGFHAQYVPVVTSETFTNPVNHVKTVQDVIWTDNSWGDSEKEHFWNGRNGYLYTDYNNGYGWKDGFIVAPNHTIGLKVDDIFGSVGFAKSDDNQKFGLFSDVILPGRPKNTYQKLYKMFNYIFSIDEGAIFYDKLEKALAGGKKISPDELDALDDISEQKTENLIKRLEKEIKTKEDFDKLPQDDELRFIFEKMAVYMYLHKNNPSMEDEVLPISSMDELEAYKEDIFADILEEFASIIAKSEGTAEHIYIDSKDDFTALAQETEKQFGIKLSEKRLNYILNGIFYKDINARTTLDGLQESILKNVQTASAKHIKNPQALEYFVQKAKEIIIKTIDENIRIKSLETPILENSPVKDEFINVVDKYLKPESQAELLLLIQQMQDVNAEKLDDFFGAIQFSDVGMIFKEPYDYVKLYKAEDSEVNKAFTDIASNQIISDYLPEDRKGDTPEEFYRDLYVKLSYLDVQKYVKSFKAEAFQKYKVRQAFPEPVVLSDEAIEEAAHSMLNSVEEYVTDIKSNDYVISFMSLYDKISKEFSNKPFYKALYANKNVEINEDNIDEITACMEKYAQLLSILKGDNSLGELSNTIEELLKTVSSADGVLYGSQAGAYLRKIDNEFKGLMSANLTVDRYRQITKEKLAELKMASKFFIEANIEPKYRNDAYNHLNKFIKLLKDEDKSGALDYEAYSFVELMKEKHIVKNPVALLHECVKRAMAGEQTSQTYNVLKGYLITALKVAQQTKLQYKLVQNQHMGINSKLKDMLPLFRITLTDGSKEPISSESGMLYLTEQLKNADDNNIILNLFLNQTGLSSDTLNALINNFNVEKTKEIIDETYDKIIKSMQELETLTNNTLEFINSDDKKYSSLKNMVEKLIEFIKSKYKNGNKLNQTVQDYIDYMSSVDFDGALSGTSPSMFKPLLNSLNGDALECITEKINSQIAYIEDIRNILKEQVKLISSIDLVSGSEDEQKREEFYKVYESVENYINGKIMTISQNIGNFQQIMQK